VAAKVAALLKCGEIEEAEIDWLLDLVHKVPRDKHYRDVRLDDLDGSSLVRVNARIGKGLDEVFQMSAHVSSGDFDANCPHAARMSGPLDLRTIATSDLDINTS